MRAGGALRGKHLIVEGTRGIAGKEASVQAHGRRRHRETVSIGEVEWSLKKHISCIGKIGRVWA